MALPYATSAPNGTEAVIAALRDGKDWRSSADGQVNLTPELVEALRTVSLDVAKDFLENCPCQNKDVLESLVTRTRNPFAFELAMENAEFAEIDNYARVCGMLAKIAAPMESGLAYFEPHTVAMVCAEAIRAGHDLPEYLMRTLQNPRQYDPFQGAMLALAEADERLFRRTAYTVRLMDLGDDERVPFGFDSSTASLAAACLEAGKPERAARVCRGLVDERRFLKDPYIDISPDTNRRRLSQLFVSVLLELKSDNDL